MSPEDRNEIEQHLKRVHEILCANRQVAGGDWRFDGWLPDGRAVRHKFKLAGAERSGSHIDRERVELGLPGPNAAN
jgi:hypothetical protein